MPVTTISPTVAAPVSVLVAVAAIAGAATHRTAAMLVEPSKIDLRKAMVLLPAGAVQFGGPPLSPFPYQSRQIGPRMQTNGSGFRGTVTKAEVNASPKEHQLGTNQILVCKWYGCVAEMS